MINQEKKDELLKYNNMKEINLKEFNINPLTCFSKDWALICAGNEENGYNAMTIAWGQIGSIWDRMVENKKSIIETATVFIRPQRYTKSFFDQNDLFTISFFDEKYRKALGYMGSHSGYSENKIHKAKLTPLFLENSTAFQEAKLIILCKKIYHSPLLESGFTDPIIIKENYPNKDFHEMFVGEIVKILINE